MLVLHVPVQGGWNTSIALLSIWRAVMKYARRESNIENKVWEVCKITFAKKANRDGHCFFFFFLVL